MLNRTGVAKVGNQYYSYSQMQSDKKRYGALDGDWAKRCIQCDGRFVGESQYCPKCDNVSDNKGENEKDY